MAPHPRSGTRSGLGRAVRRNRARLGATARTETALESALPLKPELALRGVDHRRRRCRPRLTLARMRRVGRRRDRRRRARPRRGDRPRRRSPGGLRAIGRRSDFRAGRQDRRPPSRRPAPAPWSRIVRVRAGARPASRARPGAARRPSASDAHGSRAAQPLDCDVPSCAAQPGACDVPAPPPGAAQPPARHELSTARPSAAHAPSTPSIPPPRGRHPPARRPHPSPRSRERRATGTA